MVLVERIAKYLACLPWKFLHFLFYVSQRIGSFLFGLLFFLCYR